MATVVGVMDRDEWRARTDNIVVVDTRTSLLLWVPRDLWCVSLDDRINSAFARGGHDLLRAALSEHGIPVEHSLCLRRAAVERALDGIAITVPVAEPLDFAYPLSPQSRIEDGRKRVSFRPPAERLEGERIHQWLGARTGPDGRGSDLARILRQQVLVRRLIEERFEFARALGDDDLVRASSAAAVEEVACAGADWRFETVSDLVPARVAGKQVLLRRRPTAMGRWFAGTAFGRLLQGTLPGRALARARGTLLWSWRRFSADLMDRKTRSR